MSALILTKPKPNSTSLQNSKQETSHHITDLKTSSKMEQFLPLFQLLLSSSPSSSLNSLFLSSSPSPSSFISLLLSPVNSLKLYETLPHTLQSTILSFLSSSCLRFDPLLLRSLASHVANSPVSGFWVRHAARNLLDEMSEGFLLNDGFFDLSDWLKEESNEVPCLSWLPFDISSLPMKSNEPFSVPKMEENFRSVSSIISSPLPVLVSVHSSPLSNDEIEMAMDLKREIGTVESVPEAIAFAKRMQQLFTKTQNIVEILNLIEPWEINDDLARVLLSNFSLEFETENEQPVENVNYKPLILSSIILPKLLLLQKQPSSILISTTLEFCKEHSVSVVDSILIPLIFRKEGLNIPICDLITKIIKDCLHPLQISFFIQKILSDNKGNRNFVCLNKHLEYILNDLVWNESLFQLFYNMMNKDKDIFLTPDSIEKLVLVIEESAPQLAKSLKFGNFMLSFVTKFGDKLKSEKDLLERSAEKTETFVTKAILAKLHAILV